MVAVETVGRGAPIIYVQRLFQVSLVVPTLSGIFDRIHYLQDICVPSIRNDISIHRTPHLTSTSGLGRALLLRGSTMFTHENFAAS